MKMWIVLATVCRSKWLMKHSVPGGYITISRDHAAFAVNLFKNEPYDWITPVTPVLQDNTYVATSEASVEADGDSVTWLARERRLEFNLKGKIMKSAPIDLRLVLEIRFETKPNTRLYGRGAGGADATNVEFDKGKVVALVSNTAVYVPYYYAHGDGYAALGEIPHATGHVNSGLSSEYGISYNRSDKEIIWSAGDSDAMRIYIIGGTTIYDTTRFYNKLMGLPPVPPRYALGFMACRWGWKSEEYIMNILRQFRDGKYPLDAIIMDFEWFTTGNDYKFGPDGEANYTDFGYNPTTFPEPQKQFRQYHDMGIKFGGIRKPRLGNTNLLKEAQSQGLLMNNTRNINFTHPMVQEWYGSRMKHYLDDGVDFWWNDEGETNYFTFYHWVATENRISKHRKGVFTLNRGFIPGQQRLGSMAWTGDINAAWEDLKRTPGYIVNWGLAGNAYTTCDIGGFKGQTNALLLLRWFQLGIFMPIMRTHSSFTFTPHFPFLWDTKEELREALLWRQRMIPYHYTLAHRLSRSGDLLAWPMAALYPETQGMDLGVQFMDGPSVLTSPISNAENTTNIFFPKGDWYHIQSGRAWHSGGMNVTLTFKLNEFAAFVPGGTILPLGPCLDDADQETLTIRVYDYEGPLITFLLEEGEGFETHFTYDAQKSRISWAGTSRLYNKIILQRFNLDGRSRPRLVPFASGFCDFDHEHSVVTRDIFSSTKEYVL